jgi:hypothetical protein
LCQKIIGNANVDRPRYSLSISTGDPRPKERFEFAFTGLNQEQLITTAVMRKKRCGELVIELVIEKLEPFPSTSLPSGVQVGAVKVFLDSILVALTGGCPQLNLKFWPWSVGVAKRGQPECRADWPRAASPNRA